MKRTTLFTLAAFLFVFSVVAFWQTKVKRSASPAASPFEEEEKGEDEDWREAAAFEFKITRDMSLGYVPKDRLLSAMLDVKQGLYARSALTDNTSAALTWTERGPYRDVKGPNGNPRPPGVANSGRIDALLIDLSDPTGHTIWIGSHSGGIWKTNDITAATPSWILINDAMGYLGIGSICQSPVNNNIMYAGTGDKANTGDVRGGGIWKSTDHGLTWNLLPSTTGFWNISKVLCDASGNVYMSCNLSGAGVRRSVDGGATWTNITPAGLSGKVPDMDLSTNGTLHIYCGFSESTTAGCGYRYTTSPATVSSSSGWTAAVTPFPVSRRTVQMAVSGNTLLAMPANDSDPNNSVTQFYRSTDGGANWIATAATPDARYWSCLDVAINPANNLQMIMGSYQSFSSTDGGATWTQQATGFSTTPGTYLHDDFHAFLWQGNEIIVGCDGGIFFSSDNGVSFSDKNKGLRTFEFYTCCYHPTLADYFLGGTQDNGIEQLSLPGLNNAVHVIGGDGGYTQIDQDQPQYQFAGTTNNNYRRSINGGANWVVLDYSSSAGQFINPTDYDDLENKMYMAANPDQFFRWEDPQTGFTITPVSVPAFGGRKISALLLSPYTSHRLHLGMENGDVFRVDNVHTNSPTATNIRGAGMPSAFISSINIGTNDNNVIVTYSNYGTQHVWLNTTGTAAGWTNVSGNLPDIPVRWGIFYPDDNDRAIIATDIGIWETDDLNGAATIWTQNANLPAVKTSMLQYRPSDRTLVAATHGRGIWTSIVPPVNPYIRFSASTTGPVNVIQSEATTGTTGCRRYKDYPITLNIDMPPTGNANINIAIAGGATAQQGADFDFTTNGNFVTPSTVLTFPSGSAASQSFTLRLYDDAETEGQESVTFNYTITGATNALAAPTNQTYTFIINDNDPAPIGIFPFVTTIGVNNFTFFTQPFDGRSEKSKTQFIYLASELTAAGFSAGPITSIGLDISSKTSTAPFVGLSIGLKNTSTTGFPTPLFETGATTLFTANYSTVVGMNTFVLSTPFNWDGVSNLLFEFCYNNPTGSAAGGNGDRAKATQTADCKLTWRRISTGVGCSLTAQEQTFAGSFVRPDITINGTAGKNIETVLNSTVTEQVSGAGTYYFYTNGGADIINSIRNASGDLGCVNSIVFDAGNTWQPFGTGFRSQKVIQITPTTNSGASYTVGLYYTIAELGGRAPASLRIAKTNAATMAAVTTGNTITAPTSFVPFGNGYVFTTSFTGFSKFFLIDNDVALPLVLLSFEGRLDNNTIPLVWSTSSEQNSSYFEVQKSTDGVNFYAIGRVTAAGNSAAVRNYDLTDNRISELNYYRLKMVDADGRFIMSRTILIKGQGSKQAFWVANPFTNEIRLHFAKLPQQKIKVTLETITGQQVFVRESGPVIEMAIDISGKGLSKGTYILRTTVDGKQYVNKLVKQ